LDEPSWTSTNLQEKGIIDIDHEKNIDHEKYPELYYKK